MGVRDRLLGQPEHLDAAGLARALRYGSTTLRIGATIALARSGQAAALRPLLADVVPGVRRFAARGLGWLGSATDRARLEAALRTERHDTVRAAIAGACLRCGADPDAILGIVRFQAAAEVQTWYGPRRPSAVTGTGPADAERATWAEVGRLGPGRLRPRDELIAEGIAALRAAPHGPEAASRLPGLATQAPAELRELLRALEAGSGRRSEHAFIEALGWLGDPLATPRLRQALRATDADPARGFAHRRLAAVALGRIGDPATLAEITAALEREALEFEGRPGAGMGVQFPVRAPLIWALGEIGAPGAAPILASYLGNTSGSATGGFHLPAMGALAKLGEAASRAVTPLLAGDEVHAAHARAVLDALGPLAEPQAAAVTEPLDALEADPDALRGLAHLLARRYFDAHEDLERAWRRAEGDRRLYLQAVIQGAVSFEHLRRGNPRGAWGQWSKAREKLMRLPPALCGVEVGRWRRELDAFAGRIDLEERARAQISGTEGPGGALPDESEWPLPGLDPALEALATSCRTGP